MENNCSKRIRLEDSIPDLILKLTPFNYVEYMKTIIEMEQQNRPFAHAQANIHNQILEGITNFRSRDDFFAIAFPDPTGFAIPMIESKENSLGEIGCFNISLNVLQRRAVCNILKAVARPAPYLICGPPGTGKTCTLIECCLQIYKQMEDAKVLLCSYSNSSAKNLAAKLLLNSDIIADGDLIRSCASNTKEQLPTPPQVAKVTRLWTKGSSRDDQEYKNCRIIVATCAHAAALMNLEQVRFDYVFIDDAHRLMEAATNIPINLMEKGGCCVLVGDPLGQALISSELEEAMEEDGSGVSMLARLCQRPVYQRQLALGNQYDERYLIKLNVNYRSDRRLMEISNEIIYKHEGMNEFKMETPEWWMRYLKVMHPAIFCPQKGVCYRRGKSYHNTAEALECINFVKKLYAARLRPDQVAILTPYKSQRSELIGLFTEQYLEKCDILTIDNFQSEERDIIIISTVLASGNAASSQEEAQFNSSLEFIFKPERFNMALSRARWIAIVVGDPEILHKCDHWSNYIRRSNQF